MPAGPVVHWWGALAHHLFWRTLKLERASGLAHCSLPLAARARSAAGLPGPWYRSASATSSLSFGGGLRFAGPWVPGYLTVDRASHRLPVLSSWAGGMWTPVISSQAPHHRLHIPAPRRPFLGPLVAVAGNPPHARSPGECPEGRAGRHAVPT